MSLSRADLLAAAAQPLPREEMHVPELGGSVWIRAMSGTERDAWEKSLLTGKGKNRDIDTTNVRAKLVARCLVDSAGARLLEPSDAAVLGGLRADVLNRMFEKAQRLNGVGDGDIDELGKASALVDGSDSPSS
jgi:hypothetical protein